MSILAWILSIALAGSFLAAGIGKLVTPHEKMITNPRLAWSADFSARAVKIIGALETLGAVGVILPWLTGIAPVLSPVAALGLAAVMVGAMVTHNRRRKLKQAAPANLSLLGLALAVAIIRFSQL